MKTRKGSFPLLKPQFLFIIQYIIRIHLKGSREDRNGPIFSSPPTWLLFSFDTINFPLHRHWQQNFLVTMVMFYACVVQYGSLKPHVLLSTWHVLSGTEKLNFPFYLILTNLNSHMCLVSTVVDSRVLEFLSLLSKRIRLFVLIPLYSFLSLFEGIPLLVCCS